MSKSNPNILILSAYDVGGASIAAIRQHLALLDSGSNSKFLTLHKSGNSIPEHVQFSPKSDWKSRISLKWKQRQIHKLKNSLQLPTGMSLSGEYSLPVAPFDVVDSEWWEWADLVILHWVNEWISPENLFEKAKKKPMIWVMHDMHAFTGGCHYSHGCMNFEIDCKACPMLATSSMPNLAHQFWSKKKKAIDQNNLNLTILAPSQWMVDLAGKSNLFRNLPGFAVVNPIDVQTFRPIESSICREVLGLPSDKKILLCVTQSLQDLRKGFRYLIEAINQLEAPEEWLLCTVGKIDGIQVQTSVEHKHLGTLVDERLMALVYNAADVFVHPAIEDNLPNVVVEALACGIPIAGFLIGGMPELVQNGWNGSLAAKISGKDLLNSIANAQMTKLTRNEIAAQAAQKFAFTAHANHMKIIINSILSPNLHLT